MNAFGGEVRSTRNRISVDEQLVHRIGYSRAESLVSA